MGSLAAYGQKNGGGVVPLSGTVNCWKAPTFGNLSAPKVNPQPLGTPPGTIWVTYKCPVTINCNNPSGTGGCDYCVKIFCQHWDKTINDWVDEGEDQIDGGHTDCGTTPAVNVAKDRGEDKNVKRRFTVRVYNCLCADTAGAVFTESLPFTFTPQ